MSYSVQHHRSSQVAPKDDELDQIIAAIRSLADSVEEIAVALERLAKSRRQLRRIGGK